MNIKELIRLHELSLVYLNLIRNAKSQIENMSKYNKELNTEFGFGYDQSEIETYQKEIDRLKVMYLKTVYELQHFEYGQQAI